MPETDTQKWRGQSASLAVEDDDGQTVHVGLMQDIEIEVPWELSVLRGAGSPKIQDEQKHAVEVNVQGTLMAWRHDAFDAVAQYDDSINGLDESADVDHFTVTGSFKAADGEHEKDLKVTNVSFQSPTIGGSREEWIGLTLNGRGWDVEITNTLPAE